MRRPPLRVLALGLAISSFACSDAADEAADRGLVEEPQAQAAEEQLDSNAVKAIEIAIANVRRFHEQQLPSPVSICVRAEGWGREAVPNAVLEQVVREVFDLTPHGIITGLDLCRPLYRDTACLGHFGREGLPWEATDKTEALVAAVEAAGASAS